MFSFKTPYEPGHIGMPLWYEFYVHGVVFYEGFIAAISPVLIDWNHPVPSQLRVVAGIT